MVRICQVKIILSRWRCKNHDNSASASSPIVNPGRRGAGKAPKFYKWVENCHVDEMIKRKKSVRAHKLPRAFGRWPLGPRTEAVRAAEGNYPYHQCYI